jgi:hypothetical protein
MERAVLLRAVLLLLDGVKAEADASMRKEKALERFMVTFGLFQCFSVFYERIMSH